jgi:hypothetical protein
VSRPNSPEACLEGLLSFESRLDATLVSFRAQLYVGCTTTPRNTKKASCNTAKHQSQKHPKEDSQILTELTDSVTVRSCPKLALYKVLMRSVIRLKFNFSLRPRRPEPLGQHIKSHGDNTDILHCVGSEFLPPNNPAFLSPYLNSCCQNDDHLSFPISGLSECSQLSYFADRLTSAPAACSLRP